MKNRQSTDKFDRAIGFGIVQPDIRESFDLVKFGQSDIAHDDTPLSIRITNGVMAPMDGAKPVNVESSPTIQAVVVRAAFERVVA
jgi:hypothetical protein